MEPPRNGMPPLWRSPPGGSIVRPVAVPCLKALLNYDPDPELRQSIVFRAERAEAAAAVLVRGKTVGAEGLAAAAGGHAAENILVAVVGRQHDPDALIA